MAGCGGIATITLLALETAFLGGGRSEASLGAPVAGIDYLLRLDLPGAVLGLAAAGVGVLLLLDASAGRYYLWLRNQWLAAPKLDGATFKLGLSGLIENRKPWTLGELYALPQTSQVTRHVCVEGWSMIGKWTGVPFRTFLERIGADLSAKYVGFECADGYYSSIDMASALHPQTLLTFKISDQILAPKYGYPLKLRIPTKLGFKNPKWITAMYVSNRFPGGFWEDRGYNWFAGV